MEIALARWGLLFVVGMAIAGGSVVVIWVYRALGGACYGYQFLSTGVVGGGFDSASDAVDAAEDYVDALTEVNYE